MKSPKKSLSAPRATNSSDALVCPNYQLKITLDSIKPAIWRRLSVPGDANLDWLHAVIQLAMGWTNSHLHQFEAGDRLYSNSLVNTPVFEGEPEVLDEAKFSLREVAPNEKDVLHYEYDFGDGWEHAIVVEKILPPEPGLATIAVCLAGKRACPPDDCGGPWGYEDLLEILGNPKHAEHKSRKEWLGGPFDPEAFDPARVNTFLRTLKWPHPSESQLRQALMKRDGFSP